MLVLQTCIKLKLTSLYFWNIACLQQIIIECQMNNYFGCTFRTKLNVFLSRIYQKQRINIKQTKLYLLTYFISPGSRSNNKTASIYRIHISLLQRAIRVLPTKPIAIYTPSTSTLQSGKPSPRDFPTNPGNFRGRIWIGSSRALLGRGLGPQASNFQQLGRKRSDYAVENGLEWFVSIGERTQSHPYVHATALRHRKHASKAGFHGEYS